MTEIESIDGEIEMICGQRRLFAVKNDSRRGGTVMAAHAEFPALVSSCGVDRSYDNTGARVSIFPQLPPRPLAAGR